MGRAAKKFSRNTRRKDMRVLRLDGSDESKAAFAHINAAMHSADVKGIAQIRLVGRIIDKIEAIGTKKTELELHPVTGAERPVTRWHLKDEGGSLWLESSELDELKARMSATPWVPGAAKYVRNTFEMLDAMKNEDPTPV